MTGKQFQALGKKVFLNDRRFVLKGPLSFIGGFEHILRGFYFEGSSFDKSVFYLWCFVLPLFVPRQHISFNLGKRVGKQWVFSDKRMMAKLENAVKNDGMPFIEGVRTIDNFLSFVTVVGSKEDPYLWESLYYANIIGGHIEEAERSFHRLTSVLTSEIGWHVKISERVYCIRNAMETDLHVARNILLEWEAGTVAALNLNKYWKADVTPGDALKK